MTALHIFRNLQRPRCWDFLLLWKLSGSWKEFSKETFWKVAENEWEIRRTKSRFHFSFAEPKWRTNPKPQINLWRDHHTRGEIRNLLNYNSHTHQWRLQTHLSIISPEKILISLNWRKEKVFARVFASSTREEENGKSRNSSLSFTRERATGERANMWKNL